MKVFVIMSFDNEFDELYSFIKKIFESSNHSIFRADDLLNQQNILKEIIVSISESDLILADLTGLNPNVFYELGLAHALRKNVILLTQDISELPFDLKSYRVIEYSTHFSQVEELRKKLLKIITDIHGNNFIFSNPVSDWLGLPLDKINISTTNMLTDDKSNLIIEENDDLGFLDFFADIEETFNELTLIIENFGIKTREIGERASNDAALIQKAWESESQGTSSHVRKIARKTATAINDYGNFTKNYNQEYESLWNNYENKIFRLLESQIPINTKDDFNSLSEYIETQKALKKTIIFSREGVVSMLEGFMGLLGIQKDITRASRVVEIEIKKFIGLLDKSVATIERVSELGKIKIEELKAIFSN